MEEVEWLQVWFAMAQEWMENMDKGNILFSKLLVVAAIVICYITLLSNLLCLGQTFRWDGFKECGLFICIPQLPFVVQGIYVTPYKYIFHIIKLIIYAITCIYVKLIENINTNQTELTSIDLTYLNFLNVC